MDNNQIREYYREKKKDSVPSNSFKLSNFFLFMKMKLCICLFVCVQVHRGAAGESTQRYQLILRKLNHQCLVLWEGGGYSGIVHGTSGHVSFARYIKYNFIVPMPFGSKEHSETSNIT